MTTFFHGGRRPANADMVEGYCDGLNLDNPEPSGNRSHSYRHGFLSGRSDRRKHRWPSPAAAEAAADLAMNLDELEGR